MGYRFVLPNLAYALTQIMSQAPNAIVPEPKTKKLQNALRRSTNDAKTVYDSMPPDIELAVGSFAVIEVKRLSSIAVLRGRKSCAKVILSVCYAFKRGILH